MWWWEGVSVCPAGWGWGVRCCVSVWLPGAGRVAVSVGTWASGHICAEGEGMQKALPTLPGSDHSHPGPSLPLPPDQTPGGSQSLKH